MTWLGTFYAFNASSIAERVPAAAGVYVLWRRGQWVYVGATENLRAQLMTLVEGENPCVSQEMPTDFGFELVAADADRDRRRAALIRELAPLCG